MADLAPFRVVARRRIRVGHGDRVGHVAGEGRGIGIGRSRIIGEGDVWCWLRFGGVDGVSQIAGGVGPGNFESEGWDEVVNYWEWVREPEVMERFGLEYRWE